MKRVVLLLVSLSIWIAAGALAGSGGALAQVRLGSLQLQLQWRETGVAGSPLQHPMGIAVSGSRVLVADSGNSRIVVYDLDGAPLAVWPLPDNAAPVGLAIRPDGTALVTDYTGDRILVLGPDGALRHQWGETGTGPGQFKAPSGIAVTPEGHVVVVEFMGQRVQELAADGTFVRFVDGGDPGRAFVQARPAGEGMEGMDMPMPGGSPGNPDGLFVFPTDVAAAPDGTLYVSNTHAYEILVFNADGTLRDGWGSKGSEAGQFEVPVGMATDAWGNLYVADSANFRVQGLRPDGSVFLVSRADERWYQSPRHIYSPADVAIDSQGRLYVADFAASRIQRFGVSAP